MTSSAYRLDSYKNGYTVGRMPIIRVAAIGSRDYLSLEEVTLVLDAFKKSIEATTGNTIEVVSGGCRGVDQKVEEWCKSRDVTFLLVKVEDEDHRKKSNGKLLEGVSILVAFWDGVSEGTLDAIIRAHKLKTIQTRIFVR
jgi:hypothetical protein